MGFKKIGKALSSPKTLAAGALGGPAGLINMGLIKGADYLGNEAAKNAPQRKQVELDQGTQGLMAQQAEQARLSPEQIAEQQTRGIDSYQGLALDAPTPGALQNVGPEGLDQALSKRAQQGFGENINYIKRAAKFDAPNQMLAQGEKAQAYAAQRAQGQLESFKTELQNRTAKRQARAQMIGQLTGAAGAVGGMILGGPAGASTGKSIFQTMGNPAGSRAAANEYGGAPYVNTGRSVA